MGHIYKIVNQFNNMTYIGQTIRDPNLRYTEHLRSNVNDHFHSDLRNLGKDNFSFEIIETCDNNILDEREKYWIKYYNSYYNGYNSTPGGRGTLNTYPTRPVNKYTLDGKFIESYDSISDAARALGDNRLTSAITNCCKHITTQVYRYIFTYADSNDIIEDRVKAAKQVQHHRNQPVEQYDLNGKYIKTFNTIREAQLSVGAKSMTSITNVCAGRCKSGYGYIWKYAPNPEE